MLYEEYTDMHKLDPEFRGVLEDVEDRRSTEFVLWGGSSTKIQLCMQKATDRLKWMWKVHTSKVTGHFRVNKKVVKHYVYLHGMQQDMSQFMRGCVLCSYSKLCNQKLGLYKYLPIPNKPWKSISKDFLGGFSRMR